MVFAGTVTYLRPHPEILEVTITGMDADAEDSSTIDEIDLHEWKFSKYPIEFQWHVTRTSGADDVVSVILWGQPSNLTDWINLGEIVAVTGANPADSVPERVPTRDFTGATAELNHVYRKFKVTAPDVGAAGTLNVYFSTVPRN